MNLRKADSLRKNHGLLKIRLALLREAHDNIRCDCRISEMDPKSAHNFGKFFRGVFAVHCPQCLIASALQRQMELRTKLINLRKSLYGLFREGSGL